MSVKYLDKYLYIYADCFITNGKHRFSIYDSLNGKLHFFDSDLYEIAKTQFRECTVTEILNNHNSNDKAVVTSFIEYLLDHKLAILTDDIGQFPQMKIQWDSPYLLKRAVIDIRNIEHNFDLILPSLEALLCKTLELRFYSAFNIVSKADFITLLSKYPFDGFHLVCPYLNLLTSDEYIVELAQLFRDNSRLFITFHSVPSSQTKTLLTKFEEFPFLSNRIVLKTKIISSCMDCGDIDIEKFKMLGIFDFMENNLYNGCLNRQIGIDEEGYIKNCPSMSNNYGHIDDTDLREVISNPEFTKYWHMKNDVINTCSSCEYRYLCGGCRAYTLDNTDLYSKPAKCKYIP